MSDDNETLTSALELYARGLIPVPAHYGWLAKDGYHCTCGRFSVDKPCGKHPWLNEWRRYQSQRPSLEQVTKWFTDMYGCNVGCIHGDTAGTLVLDSDYDHDGDESLVQLQNELGELPSTPTVLTGGGGIHAIYRYPQGHHIQSKAGVRGGLDIRAMGGFSMMPPSVHPSGREYAWDVDNHLEDVDIANLPETWVRFLETESSKTETNVTRSTTHAPVIDGAGQGKIIDGREEFMRQVVYKTFMRLYKETGNVPDLPILTLEAWAEYSPNVDLSKPGRGYGELVRKCEAIRRNQSLPKPLTTPPTFAIRRK